MRLPPLNAARTFEVAGRLGNFSKAADELNVTPGAVSRQIRKLEDHLGISLFTRGTTELSLTEAGRSYLEAVRDALSRLEAATRRIGAVADDRPLHIWGSRFFIRLWLVPRLPDFHARFPDQEVMITTAMPSDPMPQDIDVAIRLGDGNWNGLSSHLLIRHSLIPVCSPSYLETAPPLEQPQHIAQHTLLQTPNGEGNWKLWYDGLGLPSVAMPDRITFTSTDMAYSGALDGLGIVLGRCGFFEGDVRKGRLVVPFDHVHHADDGFYLLYQQRRPLPKRITVFRDWLLEQLKAEAPDTEAGKPAGSAGVAAAHQDVLHEGGPGEHQQHQGQG
jgi:LysR family glycine cleavage system transcriptional activator